MTYTDTPHIIYIAGFGSTNSSKKQIIEDWCKQNSYGFTGFVYPNTYCPEKIFETMRNTIPPDMNNVIFVGCSLGGFWSLVFQEIYQVPAVVINPTVAPSKTLKKYLTESGVVHAFDHSTTYTLTESIIDKYAQYQHFTNKYPRVVIISKDDEILNPDDAIATLKDKAKLLVFPDGGHSGQKHIHIVIAEIMLIFNMHII